MDHACWNCGSSVTESAVRCPSCGADLRRRSKGPDWNQMIADEYF